MTTHIEPTAPQPAVIAQPGPPTPGLRPIDLQTESPSGKGHTVSIVRLVGIGIADRPQPVTLADLLDVEPDAGQTLAVYELEAF